MFWVGLAESEKELEFIPNLPRPCHDYFPRDGSPVRPHFLVIRNRLNSLLSLPASHNQSLQVLQPGVFVFLARVK